MIPKTALRKFVARNIREIKTSKNSQDMMEDIETCALRPFALPREIRDKMDYAETMSYFDLAYQSTIVGEAKVELEEWLSKQHHYFRATTEEPR